MANSVFIFPGNAQFSGTVITNSGFLANDGSSSVPSYSFAGDTDSGMYLSAANTVRFSLGNNDILQLKGTGSEVAIRGALNFDLGTNDLYLFRDAANTLALRNGTNPQIYRIYGYLSGSRLTRGSLHSVTEAITLSGASTSTTAFIPKGAIVQGVAITITTAITGASGYTAGDGTDVDRYGDITGTAVGTKSDNTDATANPSGYAAAASAITLTAKTSNFTGGVAQVTVFYLTTAAV